MSSVTSSDSIYVELPPSLGEDQVQPLPFATNIGQGNLLTATKIATAYNVPPGDGSGVKVGIISLGGGFSQADLNKSMANLGLTTGNVTFVSVDNGTNNYTGNSKSADGENMLDLVCVAGMAPAANIVLYRAGGVTGVYYNSNSSIAVDLNKTNSFANAIQKAVDDNCDVISISWGYSEKKLVSGITQYVGDFLAGPLANAAAKNITVFVAAGDYGSQAINPSPPNPAFQIVSTDYPSVNANTIAVGGTYLTLNPNNTRLKETVYNNSESIPGFGGGGGISSMVSLPVWQTNLPYKTYPGNVANNLSNIGIPDLSAAMNAYGVWMTYSANNYSQVYGFSGTSASAPIMAGIFARYISMAGKKPDANSLHSKIYSASSSTYLDIATGNNASLLPNGYSATQGWDATTGMGVPNGRLLYDAIYGISTKVKTDTGWQPVQNIQVKTAANTWTPVKNVWTKTETGWKQVY